MIMLCSLAISDLLVGFLSQPLYIAFQLTKNRFVEPVWRMIGPSLCGVSLLTITAITVDRYLALHYHMRYATLVTESRVKYTLLTIWLAVLPLSAFVLMNIRVHVILSGVSTIICLIICTISYIGIYRIALRHQLQIRAQQQAMQTDSAANNLNIVRLKRSAVNTLAFYLALIACYFPMYVILTLSGISKKDWQTEWNFATTLVYCNSAINPFLYCWRLRELRTAVIKTAKQMLCIQTEEN